MTLKLEAFTRPCLHLLASRTSVVHLTHTLEPKFIKGIWGPYPSALLEGRWLIEGGQVSGGSHLELAGRTHFRPVIRRS
jgi:ribulose kinase